MEITSHKSPFPHWTVEGFIDRDLTESLVLEAREHRRDHRDKWVFYDNSIERGKSTTTDVAGVGTCCESLFNLLADEDHVENLRALTGIADLQSDPFLHGAGVHWSSGNSHLQVHVDYAKHPKLPHAARRVSLVA